jgi:hypothetical protein
MISYAVTVPGFSFPRSNGPALLAAREEAAPGRARSQRSIAAARTLPSPAVS